MGFGMQVDMSRPKDRPKGLALTSQANGQTNREIEITFPSHPEQVRRALQKVLVSPLFTNPCQPALEDDLRGTAEIVLAEVLNNIVEHAYADQAGDITLRLVRHDGEVHCTVSDAGAPMPGLCLPEGPFQPLKDLADLPEGGFGWFLIRSLTEGLAYQRSKGLNSLSFQLPAKQSDA
jgi:serine/threonine-protein kinase RsbW